MSGAAYTPMHVVKSAQNWPDGAYRRAWGQALLVSHWRWTPGSAMGLAHRQKVAGTEAPALGGPGDPEAAQALGHATGTFSATGFSSQRRRTVRGAVSV